MTVLKRSQALRHWFGRLDTLWMNGEITFEVWSRFVKTAIQSYGHKEKEVKNGTGRVLFDV